VVDVGSLCVDWDSVRLRPVHCPVTVVLDTKGSPEADIACTVTGPSHSLSVLRASELLSEQKEIYTLFQNATFCCNSELLEPILLIFG